MYEKCKKTTLIEPPQSTKGVGVMLLVVGILIIFLSSFVSAGIWDDGSLAAYYTFDENSGTHLPDVSDYQYNGTLINMEDEDWVSGKTGNALRFDGVDEYVKADSLNNYPTGKTELTVATWVNFTDPSRGSLVS